MKKFLFTLLLLLLLPFPAKAGYWDVYDYEVDGIIYSVEVTDFDDYGPTKANGASANLSNASGSVNIPSSITYTFEYEVYLGKDDEGYPIYETRSRSLNCPVKGVNNVYSSEMTSITLPSSIEQTELEIYGEKLKTATIHGIYMPYGGEDNPYDESAGVSITGSELTSVTFSGTAYEFNASGINLTSAHISGTVKYANLSGAELTSVSYPSTLRGLALSSPALTSVSLPSSLQSVSLSGCAGLTSVSLPSSLQYVYLSGCTGLKSVDASRCASLPSLDLSGLSALTSVSLPSSLQGLNFRDCPSLKSITIPEGVTGLSCYGSTRLKSLVWNARNCTSNGGMYTQDIEQVTIGEEVIILPNNFMSGSMITSVVVPNSVTTIGTNAFYGCTDLQRVTLGTGIKNIGDYMFHECHALSQISIPNSVTRIGNYAFNYCDGLEEIAIPSSVKNIGEGAFYWCTGLRDVVVPEGVDSIGKRAFYYCRELRSVDLPSSLTFIGAYAFFSDEYLANVTCRAITPPRIENVNCFYPAYHEAYSDATLYVPSSSIDEYRSARYWSYFNHINPIIIADIVIAGDVDADGRVSIADVTELIDLLLMGTPDVSSNPSADVDSDGRITIADVTELIDKLLNGN